MHPLPSVQTGGLLRDCIVCIYAFPNKNSVSKKIKVKMQQMLRNLLTIIPSPECLVSVMSSICAGGPGITVGLTAMAEIIPLTVATRAALGLT